MIHYNNACNCEVKEWTSWTTKCSQSCGTGQLSRSRVCSEKMGIALGFLCHTKDEHTVYENKQCNTQNCRKLDITDNNLYV